MHRIPTSLDFSTTIYRYMSTGKFLDLIQSRSLFMSSISNLEDRHEGANFNEQHLMWKYFVYVNCWNSAKDESNTMWKAYVPGGEGVCVVSSIGALLESIKSTPSDEESLLLSKVTYGEENREIDAEIAPLFCKRDFFQSEQEIRLVLDKCDLLALENSIDGQATLYNYLKKKGIALPIEVEKLIKKIIVSPSSNFLIPIIQELISKNGLNLEIFPSQI